MPDAYAISWIGIVFLATLGALATVALRTGSFAPLFPTVTRGETPRKFWWAIVGCVGVLVINIVNLFRIALGG